MPGSVKNKTVAPELLKERESLDFDKNEIKEMFWECQISRNVHK